ncbi:MAG: hypothetical protein A2X49_06190 [Lentisphaerae bacterium GWF2_52_8]|nr:MAG: hypothetical protein A2X49_06190 [Lentisphaerae bacterium GWF2_52_8]
MERLIFVGLLLFSGLAHAQLVQENTEKLELVKAGKIAEARADWWGFNETDSTKSLQSAIDSGIKKLIVPNMGKPWIVNPIKLASNQEIVLEPGTIIEAIRGGFKGKNDCLFSARGGKNITISGKDAILRMHKKDYQDKSQYEPAEWRMGIGLYSCENVKLSGLTIMSSGGDGIYIGNCRKPLNYCKDIIIKDCVIDDNHRQGISVISVVNLLIENCVIKNTKGSAPQAGIDFEPNAKDERLFGITMKDCVFENNASAAVIICSHPGADTEPISINLENCKAIGTGFSGGFGANPPVSKIDAKMTNCTATVKGKTKVYNDFWKDFQNMQTLDKQKQEIVERLKRIDVIGMKLKPLDSIAYKEAKKLPIPYLRGKSSLIVSADEGEELSCATRLLRDYGKGMSVHVLAPSGTKTGIAKFSGKEGVQALSFDTKENGTYIIELAPGPGWFEVKPGKYGIAMLALNGPLHLFGHTALGTLYFYVPAGTSEFYVQAAGEGSERIKASVYDAEGNLFETQDEISMVHKFVVSRKDASKGEIWSIKTEKSADFYLEDFYIDLIGIPPILSPDKACLLVPEGK